MLGSRGIESAGSSRRQLKLGVLAGVDRPDSVPGTTRNPCHRCARQCGARLAPGRPRTRAWSQSPPILGRRRNSQGEPSDSYCCPAPRRGISRRHACSPPLPAHPPRPRRPEGAAGRRPRKASQSGGSVRERSLRLIACQCANGGVTFKIRTRCGTRCNHRTAVAIAPCGFAAAFTHASSSCGRTSLGSRCLRDAR